MTNWSNKPNIPIRSQPNNSALARINPILLIRSLRLFIKRLTIAKYLVIIPPKLTIKRVIRLMHVPQ